jgi:hypothetical protein
MRRIIGTILRPGKASEKTPKGVIPPSLCEISQNASRRKIWFWPNWNGLELRLGIEDVGFGLSRMAWNGGSQFWPTGIAWNRGSWC